MFGKLSKTKTYVISLICIIVCLCFLLFLINFLSKNQKEGKSKYIILAANDLGMHCYQSDYSNFLILPPGNNLKVQVFLNEGGEAKLINSGIEVSYEIINNTTSSNKINFWKYAADYGYNVPEDIGITGNGLKGKMVLSDDKKYYIATAVPVTPYNDGSNSPNPYQMAKVSVNEIKTGKELAKTSSLVVPVSDEMKCEICHGGATDASINILKAHDELSGTNLTSELEKGIRYKCSDCHEDNILNQPGEDGIKPLSEAMHGFHAGKMEQSKVEPECYSCHPGPTTLCYRGEMYSAGINCINSKCHGDMANVAITQEEGRQAWLDEPNCSNCHGDKYSVNEGQLYRTSYLNNNAESEMNGIILCLSCHNSPHAEWKSTLTEDNILPASLLGYPSFINKCTVCHEGNGTIHDFEQKIKEQGEN